MELGVCKKTQERKISASQLISNMICMNYDHNKKFGLLKFHSGYGKFNLNSPKGYSLKIINAQTGDKVYHKQEVCFPLYLLGQNVT